MSDTDTNTAIGFVMVLEEGRKHTSLVTDVGTVVGMVSVWVSMNTTLMCKLGPSWLVKPFIGPSYPKP